MLFTQSCSKTEKAEVTVNKAAFADTPASYNQVYKIERIDKGKEGLAVNFVYLENGSMKNFADVTKGKVVFLNFWGTWCPPCRKEIPDIIQLQKNYQSKNLMVIGIAVERDVEKAVSKVSEFGGKQGMNYMNIIGNEAIGEAYGGISAVPTTFIIDKKGVIVEKIVGANSYEEFEKIIKKYL
jgi:thiol-disulfide isomerase/thioredoxin